MNAAGTNPGGLLNRLAATGRACARNPLHPLTSLIFWQALRMDEERAVRWMLPFWFLVGLGQRPRRRANIQLLTAASAGTSAPVTVPEKQQAAYLSRMNLHIMRLSVQTPAELTRSVRVTGEENIAAALEAGRGLLLIIAHTGTWWHAPLYLGARGHAIRAVVNPGLPPRVASYLRNIAQRFGASVSYVGQSAYQDAREAFAQKQIFVSAVDRSLRGARSQWLPCGPAELPMDPGPAILALRQRVPVIQAETFHDAAGRSCINYSAPLSLGAGTALATPEAILSFWSQSLYEQWLRHPAQWWALNFFSLRPPTALPSPPQNHRE